MGDNAIIPLHSPRFKRHPTCSIEQRRGMMVFMMRHKISRRQLLGLIGGTTVLLVTSCGAGPADWLRRLFSRKTDITSFPPCIVRPEQMEGPYFVDNRLHRSDIRSDPSDGSVKEGLPLDLTVRVHEIRGEECLPLPDAMVDFWQCDADGIYSDARDRSFNTRGKKFLRGYQMTDTDGTVRFQTIFPGAYPGRTVHIHFKIRMTPETRMWYEYTSQLYFDDALTDRILAQPPYPATGRRRIRNRQDGIFRRGGDELMVELSPAGTGYTGTFDIGLLFT